MDTIQPLTFMQKFAHEFKEFVSRGNVIDLAVGVIIGGAFGNIVTSLVNDIIMPPIGLIIGGVKFTDLKITLKSSYLDAIGNTVPAVTLNIGNFIQVIFNFLIIAFAIFTIIKVINRLKRENKSEKEMKKLPDDVKLLKEIRDILKKTSK